MKCCVVRNMLGWIATTGELALSSVRKGDENGGTFVGNNYSADTSLSITLAYVGESTVSYTMWPRI